MMFLYKGRLMIMFMPLSGRKIRTLKLTLTWFNRWIMGQIMSLLFLKHSEKEVKGSVHSMKVFLVI